MPDKRSMGPNQSTDENAATQAVADQRLVNENAPGSDPAFAHFATCLVDVVRRVMGPSPSQSATAATEPVGEIKRPVPRRAAA